MDADSGFPTESLHDGREPVVTDGGQGVLRFPGDQVPLFDE